MTIAWCTASAVRCFEHTRTAGQRFGPACGGTTSVEMAILLPVFMLFVFGALQLGWVQWVHTTLQSSVEAAARCAAINKTVCGTAANVQTYASTHTAGLSVPASSFVLTQPSCGYMVSVTYAYSFIPPGLFPGPITLSAQSCHP